MKNSPHHMRKQNRQVIRSEQRADKQENSPLREVTKLSAQEQTTDQKKKFGIDRKAKENPSLSTHSLNSREKNKNTSKDEPNFNRNTSDISSSKSSQKKKPRN